MRTIKTIILRLLVDTNQPQTLRGMLNAVADGHLYSFADEKSLLKLLYRINCPESDSGENDPCKGSPFELDLKS
jgi:hypothetical protein